MSTKVVILYDATKPGQKKLAGELEEMLSGFGILPSEKLGAGSSDTFEDGADSERCFEVKRREIFSSVDMEQILTEIFPETCQLLIDINLTGYENQTTGGFASINRLPMDIVNVITGTAEEYADVLGKTQSFMSRFIFTKESEVKKAEEIFPHLWHIACCRDAEEIVAYVREMELRFNVG